MRILVCAGSWKEGPSAEEICFLIKQGIVRSVESAEIELCPMADGGTGLADVAAKSGGTYSSVTVSGPLRGRKVEAKYVTLDDGTVVFESATAAGLALVPKPRRNPLETSTVGVGEVVLKAYEQGARKFIIGCGDSSTNDGGFGFLSALGFRHKDSLGEPLLPIARHLSDVRSIEHSELSRELAESCVFEVAGNPNSILLGPEGTSRKYGPQKGATETSDVLKLERGLENYVPKLEELSGKYLATLPGAGGAGGLAGGILAGFETKLSFSFDVVRRFVQLDEKIARSDLVIVGEGLFDKQTITGKLPCSVGLLSKRYEKPVAALVGGIDEGVDMAYFNGVDFIESATKRPCSLEEAMSNVDYWLPDAADRLARKLIFSIGNGVVK